MPPANGSACSVSDECIAEIVRKVLAKTGEERVGGGQKKRKAHPPKSKSKNKTKKTNKKVAKKGGRK